MNSELYAGLPKLRGKIFTRRLKCAGHRNRNTERVEWDLEHDQLGKYQEKEHGLIRLTNNWSRTRTKRQEPSTCVIDRKVWSVLAERGHDSTRLCDNSNNLTRLWNVLAIMIGVITSTNVQWRAVIEYGAEALLAQKYLSLGSNLGHR